MMNGHVDHDGVNLDRLASAGDDLLGDEAGVPVRVGLDLDVRPERRRAERVLVRGGADDEPVDAHVSPSRSASACGLPQTSHGSPARFVQM